MSENTDTNVIQEGDEPASPQKVNPVETEQEQPVAKADAKEQELEDKKREAALLAELFPEEDKIAEVDTNPENPAAAEPSAEEHPTAQADEKREAALLAELFPDEDKIAEVDTNPENPAAVEPSAEEHPTAQADEGETEETSGKPRQYHNIASLLQKSEKRPLESAPLDKPEPRAVASDEQPTQSSAPKRAKKHSAHQYRSCMKGASTDSHDGDISQMFKKLPSREEAAREKREANELAEAQRRLQLKKESENYLYNKEQSRVVPGDFHSEKFRDVPMGSLVKDPDLAKAGSMKTISMEDFLNKMKAKKDSSSSRR